MAVCFVGNYVIPERIPSILEDGTLHMSIERVKQLEVSHQLSARMHERVILVTFLSLCQWLISKMAEF